MKSEQEIRAGILVYVNKAVLEPCFEKESAYLLAAKALVWALGQDENKVDTLFNTALDTVFVDDTTMQDVAF